MICRMTKHGQQLKHGISINKIVLQSKKDQVLYKYLALKFPGKLNEPESAVKNTISSGEPSTTRPTAVENAEQEENTPPPPPEPDPNIDSSEQQPKLHQLPENEPSSSSNTGMVT